MANIIFYFSGTGNSLKAAKTIAKELGDGEIVSMAKPGKYVLSKQYDSVGFIFPVYFFGLPKRVIRFIEELDLGNNKNAYYYGVTVYGGMAGNTVYQLYELLHDRHRVRLGYCEKIKLFSNYIVKYEKDKNAEKIARELDQKLVPVINSIKSRKSIHIAKWTKILSFINAGFIKTVSDKDKNYNVGNECTGCGICKEVCPVNNIEMVNARPAFKHNCEQCMACIQYCPQKAINYRNATQSRGRFTNPEIDYKELSGYNKR